MENHARGRNNNQNQRGRGKGKGKGKWRANADQGQFEGEGRLNINAQSGGSGGGGGGGDEGSSSRDSGELSCGKELTTLPFIQFGSLQLHATDPPTPELQPMEISHTMPMSSHPESCKLLPVKRPDNGGNSATQNLPLFVNHFYVSFNPSRTILQYDVNIKLEMQPKNGRNIEISKPEMRIIRDKLFSDNPRQFPLSVTAYDGEKSIFSAVELPEGRFKVNVSKGEGLRDHSYEFTIKLVKMLELRKLEAYLTGSLQSVPREILQGMDLVMKENATRHCMQIGPCIHAREHNNDVDLGGGIIASKGFQHTLKPTSQGLVLCVDYSVLPIRKQIPVLQYIEEHLNINFTARSILGGWERRSIENALNGLKVTVTHRKTTQQYRIGGLTRQTTKDIRFVLEDCADSSRSTGVGLLEYFRDKYKKEIKYKYLPCLDFSKNKKINYVPMEFCELVEGQRYPKEKLERNAAQTLKSECLAEPKKRMQVICDIVKERDGPCGGDTAENFEISVKTEMTEVVGRVITPPDLKLGDANGRSARFTPNNKYECQWSLANRSVLEGKQVERWAVLNLTSFDRFPLNADRFIQQLMARCKRLGVHMDWPLFCEASNMDVLSNTITLRDLLKSINQRARSRLQILICVMTKRDPGYKNLKRISETEIGIMTQCCLVNHANTGKEIYLGNLALKINAKLGGSNVELFDRLPHFERDRHVMFIGADVNHPGSWNTSSPSIAAVVATINWPAANRYAARIRPQCHRKEKIENFGEICLELINIYSRLNKVRPQKIVIFRDGVGDNQFDMVLNEELTDLKKTINSDGYNPTITLVVAQKRHQTRLFPQDESDVRGNGNVFPGTVVDTKVVHPHDFDFYICTHYGSLGTSKPTHYTVLYDDHGFTSDEMQRLIYNICYTFARCTKPVSLVPPVYYADLAAYRGRLYHDALMDSSPASTVSSPSSSTLSPSSSSSAPSSLSSSSGYNGRNFKLHNDLENQMFFC
ncbi:hypothetical protein AQUCO_03000400v1 [Aquilegia coerulea]|uniref:Piwi domain-containing protein n=1 Tax=Aquilegia coerulea TaxID=218851 RepID=A0A2G5D2U4_AQUCA|nr:hypothetical protein AQUCO_03000400v1 [Aquilegia coerulea]